MYLTDDYENRSKRLADSRNILILEITCCPFLFPVNIPDYTWNAYRILEMELNIGRPRRRSTLQHRCKQ